MKEKKARVEDAMHATKAAVEEGIVPGGGLLLTTEAMVCEIKEDKKDDMPAGGPPGMGGMGGMM